MTPTPRRTPAEPPRAIVVNEPSQAALARAYAYIEALDPVVVARRVEREDREPAA